MRPLYPSPLFLSLLFCTALAVNASAIRQITGSAQEDRLEGSDTADEISGGAGDDQIGGSGGDDLLLGDDGNDVIRGEDGDDIIVGGAGRDLLYGGPGADRFVFGLSEDDIDEIVDFEPEQGDEIWILLAESADDRRVTLSRLRSNSMGLKLRRAPVNEVRLNTDGDVEVRLKDRRWLSLVKTGRADLKLKARQHTDALSLQFRQRF